MAGNSIKLADAFVSLKVEGQDELAAGVQQANAHVEDFKKATEQQSGQPSIFEKAAEGFQKFRDQLTDDNGQAAIEALKSNIEGLQETFGGLSEEGDAAVAFLTKIAKIDLSNPVAAIATMATSAFELGKNLEGSNREFANVNKRADEQLAQVAKIQENLRKREESNIETPADIERLQESRFNQLRDLQSQLRDQTVLERRTTAIGRIAFSGEDKQNALNAERTRKEIANLARSLEGLAVRLDRARDAESETQQLQKEAARATINGWDNLGSQ